MQKPEGSPVTPPKKAVKRKHSNAFNGNSSTTSEFSDAKDTSFNSAQSKKEKETNGMGVGPAKNVPRLSTPPPPPPMQDIQFGDIPIFTDQFLEHNRRVESDLRQLRKSNTDYELQNSVLEKHMESMTNGVAKIVKECEDIKKQDEMIEQYLQQLRTKLTNALAGLSITSKPGGANINNIDAFMEDLAQMTANNCHGPASLNKAKDILRKLDLNIQL